MQPAEALVAALKADSGFTATFGGRIYPTTLPDSTAFSPSSANLPAVVYFVINENPSGMYAETDVGTVRWPHFQLTVFGQEYAEAHDAVGVLRTALMKAPENDVTGRLRECVALNMRDMVDAELTLTMALIDIRISFI